MNRVSLRGIDVEGQFVLFVLKLFLDRGKSSEGRFQAWFEAFHQHRALILHFEVQNIELDQLANGKRSYRQVVLYANEEELSQ